MSESAGKTSTPGDALLHGGVHPGSSSDDPTKRDPTINSSQILLEALQNFVISLVHVANGKNRDINRVDLGLEAEKLLIALQEFISSMITQSRVGQPQGIEVDLDGCSVDDVPSDDAMNEAPDTAMDCTIPRASKDLILKQTKYQIFMGKLQEAVRNHVFGKMPIRVLHFTDIPRDSGAKLQITLLDRNGVCGRVIEEIRANYSEKMFRENILEKENLWLDSNLGDIEEGNIQKLVQEYTKYAILSHTWLRGSDSEVTYGAWQTDQFDSQQPGYRKLANFCKSAWKDHGLTFGWMDTICINKDSSSELDESIRSMYKWYKNSEVCITYLAETDTLGNIHRDPWFTRGWTFQELFAPLCMSFYGKGWKTFVLYTEPGDKRNPNILDQLYQATTITKYELDYPSRMPISRKMQLAARRKVTREEDIAYSLMGICDVSISIAYGEGAERAFFRLMTEILNTSSEIADIFNCSQMRLEGNSSIIPPAPSAYIHSSRDIMGMRRQPPIEPLLLTHVGLRTPIVLMPSLRKDSPWFENHSIGDYYAIVDLPALLARDTGSYHLLDKGIGMASYSYERWTFGILNFGGDATTIYVPDRCLAVCFKSQGQVEWDPTSSGIIPICTKKPIVFHLKNWRKPILSEGHYLYSLKRSELEKHRMTFTTMYL